MMEGASKIIPVKVAVRCRPLVEKERNEGCQTCIQFVPGEPQIVIGKDKAFTFDFVFEPSSSQQYVYSESVLPLMNGLFKGYNATVLAYGQTGSGKTFSMGGGYGISSETDEDIIGVIPRVIRDLYDGIAEREADFEFIVKVSYLEIYKEDLLDLLVPPQKRDKDQITIREEASGGIKLMGMTELEVKSFAEMMAQLESGSQSRTTGATAMNNQSSRSHAIFTIYLERKSKKDSHDFCKAKFHLVDLAGSERLKKTHAEGDRMKEGININRGLLALGNVISALGDESAKARGHIPYRDSKLTRLLQDSLGGNSHTVMIACISPADSNMEETISTLRYADRARKIKNKPVVNRDPNAAEIMRLRALVQELQCGMPLRSSNDSLVQGGASGGDYKQIMERNKKLEEENLKLATELQLAVSQSTEMMEKVVMLELTCDRLRSKLHELKEKMGQSITQMLNTTQKASSGEDGETQTSYLANAATMEQQMNLMKSVHEQMENIEMDDMDEQMGSTVTEDGRTSGDSPAGSVVSEELRNNHVLRQAKLGRELQELNNMLVKKQELAGQMKMNDEQMKLMREQYEAQMKEMESEIESLQKEKEDLAQTLNTVKATANSNKIAEQRRKRLQELEAQIAQLKKKMTEQSRMLKLKEQTDKQVEKLNQEIMLMKQQRVKLMNHIKEDAEQFRKLKQESAKEVLQLKSQDRKRIAEIAKLQLQHVNQQVVLRRKAEEAAAANNRLKEILLRQKSASDDRAKKQENADMSGIGARVRKMLSEEVDFLVSVEAAKLHLASQMAVRKELNENLQQVKKRINPGPAAIAALSKRTILLDSSAECTDDDKVTLAKQQKELEQQIDLCNVQIAELQQKLIDADQDERCKSRWNNIHTMIEAKCAMKYLLGMAVTAKVECDKKDSEIEDMRTNCDEAVKTVDVAEEDWKRERNQWESEMHAMRTEHESKILYLLNELRNSSIRHSSSDVSQDDELRKRLKFQEIEIGRLAKLEAGYASKVNECDSLRKELTKTQYNMSLQRSGSLMPPDLDADSTRELLQQSMQRPPPASETTVAKFFSPAFLDRQTRRRTFGVAGGEEEAAGTSPSKIRPKKKKINKKNKDNDAIKEVDSDMESADDNDEGDDPDWEHGLTPGFELPKTRARLRLKTSAESTANRTFTRDSSESSNLGRSTDAGNSTDEQELTTKSRPSSDESKVKSRKRASDERKENSGAGKTTKKAVDGGTTAKNASEKEADGFFAPLNEGLNGAKKRKLQPGKSSFIFTDPVE